MEKDTAAFTRLLLDGNQNRAWQLVEARHADGAEPIIIFQELLTPAMAHIGILWEEDQISVADEHLATTTCDFVLSRYQQHILTKRGQTETNKKAMFLCIEDELHHLGLKMVSILFELYGYKTKLFGANLPLEYALKTAADWQPDVIGLSFSLRKHAHRLNHYIQELEQLEHSPAVIVGGRLASTINKAEYCSEKTRLFHALTDLDEWLSSSEEKENSHV